MKTQRLGIFVAAICAAGSLWAADGSWTNALSGNWSLPDNWASGIVADGSGFTAWFTNVAPGAVTVANDAERSLLGVKLGGSGFTLTGSTLTNDSDGFIQTLVGDHSVLLPLSLSGNTTVTAVTNRTLTLGGVISGNGGLTLSGGRIVMTNANTYAGATKQVTGIVEINAPAALGNSSTDPANLILGEGTLRYTGASATLDRGFTLLPGAITNRAAVIDVTNANTTLTVAGKVVTVGGSFIKTGSGTLAFTYPGYQEIGKTKPANGESASITYDANGIADTNSYCTFVVDKGRMVLGAPGQTNVIVASSGWIGSKTLASPRLDIIGGVTRFTSGYLTIGRGTGLTNSMQSPSVYISGGSYVEVTGTGLVMDNAQGLGAAHRCRPSLSLDNSTLKVTGDVFLSEDANATSVVNVVNNSLFISDSTDITRWGLSISQSAGAKTDLTFSNNSTGLVYWATIGRGGALHVVSNSVLMIDGTPLNAVNNVLNLGTARFSGGLLKPRTPALTTDWFVSLPSLLVGASDMTVDVSSHAWLDAVPKADPASPGGKLIKTGAGTLAMRPAAVNVQVNAGKVALVVEHPNVTNGITGTLSLSPGTSLELAASGGASAMNLALSGAPLTLLPHSLSSNPDLWKVNGRASRRWDGLLRLTPDGIATAGSMVMYRRYPVTNAWSATFSYIVWSTQGTPADGVAFVIHNDPRGTNALGTGAQYLGYEGTGAITNSVAVGIDPFNKRLRFGKQGVFGDSRAFDAALPQIAATPVKTYFSVSYDGAGLLTCVMTRPGFAPYRFDYAVDVKAEVGSDGMAYLTFTGGSGGSWGQHSIADFLFVNAAQPATPSYCRYGGQITLAGGDSFNASLTPSALQRGFVMGQLAYADQSVVNASKPLVLTQPTLEDQGLWKLNGQAHWLSPGRLAVSTNAFRQPAGMAYTTNRYPVAGSWVARFGYDRGDASSQPADFLTFTLQNKAANNTETTPNPGLSLMWRYFDGNVFTTQLKLYTNGVVTVVSTNIVPVDLKNGNHANMTVAYDAPTKTMTVTTSQVGAGTNVTVIAGVDVVKAIGNGATEAYIGFTAATGDSWAENIVSDFSFTSEATANAVGGYLGFDAIKGSGTLIKRGTAALGLSGDIDRPTSNLVLRLEQGGLVLRKNNLEPLSVTGPRSDWTFTSEGKWGDEGTLQFCTVVVNSTGTATTARRVRVKEPWTITYSFLFGVRSNPPADATSFFLHNDPRGPSAVGGATGGGGYSGITKSIGLRWYFYPNNQPITNTIAIGRNGVIDDGASRQSHAPITLYKGVTDITIRYNPANSNLTSIMKQGGIVITNTFTGVNIPTDVGSDYAYIGFGGGCGGSFGEMRVRDFTMTYDAPLPDLMPNQQVLAGLTLPSASTNTVTLDTSISNSSFRIAAATVGAGAAFGLDAAQQSGTLAIDAVTQSGDATYPVAAGCSLVMSNLVGGATFTKTGAGTLTLKGAAATYTGKTVLSGGTLSIDAARLPSATDLYVTSGATLDLAFSGKQYVHTLFVNGAQMPGGRYTSAKVSWISGPGALIVTYPPMGTLLMMK